MSEQLTAARQALEDRYTEVFQRVLAIDPQLAHDFDHAACAVKVAELDDVLVNGLRGQELEGELVLGSDGPTLRIRVRMAEEVSA